MQRGLRSGEERISVMVSGGGSGGSGGEIRIAGERIYFIYTDHGGDVVDSEEDAEEGRSSNDDGDGNGQADTHLGDLYCSTATSY